MHIFQAFNKQTTPFKVICAFRLNLHYMLDTLLKILVLQKL